MIPTTFTCSSNTKAVYTVQITGYMAKNIQQYLYDYHLATQLDLQIATLYVCDKFCRHTTGNTVKTRSDNNTSITGAYDDDNTVAISLASCSVALLLTVMVIAVLYR